MASDAYAEFADAPQDPYAEFSDAALATPPPMVTVPPQTAAPAQSWGSWLNGNVVSPLARSAVRAITALPLMAQDFGVAVRNVGSDLSDNGISAAASHLIHGGQYPYELPSTSVNRVLDAYTQAPTTTAGKLSELANSMILGGAASVAGVPGMTAPTYGNVPAAFVSPSAPSSLTSAQQSAADAGQALGMRLTPGQQIGSRALQQFEAKLQSQPWTSGPFNRLAAGNQRSLNQAAAQGIGESGNEVSSEVLNQANDRMGQVFESVRNPNNVVVTRPPAAPFSGVGVSSPPAATSSVLDAIDKAYEGLLPAGSSIRDNTLVNQLDNLTSSGSITAEQLGQIGSKLGKSAYKQMTTPAGDRDLGQALYAVKDHVDDLVQQTLSPQEAAAYGTTKVQYRNLMNLISRPGIVNPASGNISGTALANKLQQADRLGYTFGANQTPMYAAARFAKAFPSLVNDSGTATRSFGGLAGLPLAIPANVFARAYLSTPGQAVVRGLMGVPGAVTNGVSPDLLSGLMTGIANSQPSLWTSQ